MTGIIQTYKVQFLNGPLAEVHRWVLDCAPDLVMGGSIVAAQDWQALYASGIRSVLNLETEHDDEALVRGVPLWQYRTPDDGTMKPPALILPWIKAGREAPKKLYIHCQAGGSRTPMALYAILRDRGFSPGSALGEIQRVKPSFGSQAYHVNYLASVEQALVSAPR